MQDIAPPINAYPESKIDPKSLNVETLSTPKFIPMYPPRVPDLTPLKKLF